jgi:hypothetical protein
MLTITILLIVFSVFSMAVTADQPQNQTRGHISNHFKWIHINLARYLSNISNGYNSTYTNIIKGSSNSVWNNINSTSINGTKPLSNQTQNQTNSTPTNSTNQNSNPILNNTNSTPTNSTNQNSNPILNNTNSTPTNSTNQTSNDTELAQNILNQVLPQILSYLNSVRDMINQLLQF